MGNAHTKDGRAGARHEGYEAAAASRSSAPRGEHTDRSRRASSRPEVSALNLLTGSGTSSRRERERERERDDRPFESKETKQEREARRLERERVKRLEERERSMREEHVDGGFLVTMGVYTALEDFSKPTVRQLQLERKIAPFWRGLDDFDDTWAEHQIVAAARGLDIPPADHVPEHLVPQPKSSESPNLNSLTVPMGPRTLSAASNETGSNPGSSLPSPTLPGANKLKSPHKAIAAALSISSRNGSQQDIGPREINLPHDPWVNGQQLEVFLYKDGIECPICCMYYPKYLNKTRCCDQFICSECFVQIKRPEPHLPEHHEPNAAENAEPNPDEPEGELIMEPACCPYCTQTEFGVTYEPPPFRRGLACAYNGQAPGSSHTAMSSTSSLNSTLSPTSAATAMTANRRRTTSLSATAPGVITTDRIRPEWTTKLQAARAQQRRRAAAADALHHAAFVMGGAESSRSIFGRSSRSGPFSRRSTRGGDSPSSSTAPASQGAETPSRPQPGARVSSARTGPSQERIDAAHLENMMMAEAIRLSLADEEDRRKKAEKEAKKEQKKKEKDERKAEKRKSSIYGGLSSASASTLSLGLGRLRGNSSSTAGPSQAQRAEATVGETRPTTSSNESVSAVAGPNDVGAGSCQDKGKGIERSESAESASKTSTAAASSVSSLPIPISQQQSRGSSHLRQMSNASSVSSSGGESLHGTHGGQQHGGTEDPRSSDGSLAAGRGDDDGAGTEPMFNYRSLSEMVGVDLEGGRSTVNDTDGTPKSSETDKESAEHVEHVEHSEKAPATAGDEAAAMEKADKDLSSTAPRAPLTVLTGSPGSAEHSAQATPSVMITPETPAADEAGIEAESKQLGHGGQTEHVTVVTPP